MSLRVGSVVYSCWQGLGVLARSFFDAGVLTDVLVVDRAGLKSRPLQPDWFPGADVASSRDGSLGTLIRDKGRDLVERCDVMLFLETPHDWTLIDYARERGVKTALMPMYECMPDPLPATPDLMVCPSLLDLRYYSWYSSGPEPPLGIAGHVLHSADCPFKAVYLPVPAGVPWRQRARAEVFVHNAGHGGLLGRNGTGQLLDAMRHVRSPLKLIVRSQDRLQWGVDDPRVEVRVGSAPYEALWDEGDVFVFPDKFNGLSLPLQEARAAGMLVMATNRFPANTWLPSGPLIPVSGYQRDRVSGRCLEFDSAIVDPRDIAATMDAWFGADIIGYSRSGKAWADEMSWQRLRPKYVEVLEGLCR